MSHPRGARGRQADDLVVVNAPGSLQVELEACMSADGSTQFQCPLCDTAISNSLKHPLKGLRYHIRTRHPHAALHIPRRCGGKTRPASAKTRKRLQRARARSAAGSSSTSSTTSSTGGGLPALVCNRCVAQVAYSRGHHSRHLQSRFKHHIQNIPPQPMAHKFRQCKRTSVGSLRCDMHRIKTVAQAAVHGCHATNEAAAAQQWVKLQPSLLPDAGLGVFAQVAFQAEDAITLYTADFTVERSDAAQLNALDAAQRAYTVRWHRGEVAVGCRVPTEKGGLGSFVNSARQRKNKGYVNNAAISYDVASKQLYIKATQPIIAGSEILISYGPGYVWQSA
jgi:hypothetical protein